MPATPQAAEDSSMHHTYEFLQTLTVVLCAAAVTTVLFQRLRQPVVLGYLLAGLVVGPHVPIPLHRRHGRRADAGRVGRDSADVFARASSSACRS